jgi:hypothetical protein
MAMEEQVFQAGPFLGWIWLVHAANHSQFVVDHGG